VGAAVGPLVSGLVYNSNGFAAVMLFPSAINILLVRDLFFNFILPWYQLYLNQTYIGYSSHVPNLFTTDSKFDY